MKKIASVKRETKSKISAVAVLNISIKAGGWLWDETESSLLSPGASTFCKSLASYEHLEQYDFLFLCLFKLLHLIIDFELL